MTNEIEKYNEKTFEDIKHIDEKGNEYWEARELQQILGYKEWRYFATVIEKAQVACSQSDNNINSHFGVNTKIVKTKAVRKTIEELGGTMPEELPTPTKSIKQIEKEEILKISNL